MIRWRGLLAALVLLLAGCGGDPRLQPLASDAVVLAFGDSLTWGTGAGRDQGYPARLGQLLGRRVVNAGVPGETSAEGLARLPGELASHRPDLVVLVHGGNDFLRRLPRSRTRQQVGAMVSLALEAGADVVMLGVPGPSLTLSAPELYAEIAEEHAVPLDDGVLPKLMRDGAYKSDQVHFNAAGYAIMAEAVHELLRDHGALD